MSFKSIPTNLTEMKLSEVFYLIGTDIEKYAEENELELNFLRRVSIFFLPCVLCIALHRLAHYFYRRKLYLVSRFIWTMNVILFSADIVPFSSIGSHFYMPHPVGIVLMANIGKHGRVYAQVGLGGGRKAEDIGAGRGAPVLGDYVTVGACSKVMGSVRVGNHVTIGPATVVFKDVPDGAIVFGVPARIVKKDAGSG